jgi:hypothetical protein
MKKTETRMSTPQPYEATVEMTCDICGRKVTGSAWENRDFKVNETEVKLSEGERYPDDATGEDLSFDICPECFVAKLIPWVEAHGFGKVTRRDWDF